MKFFYCLLTLVLFQVGTGMGQCVPDQLYADSVFGLWPDTTENFPSATQNTYYETVVDLKVPVSAGDIPGVNPVFSALTIDSIEMTGVSNLPPGLGFECFPSWCAWQEDSQGCITISGTPVDTGTFILTIDLLGYPVFPATSVPFSFDGYKIVVSPDGSTSIKEVASTRLQLKQNAPNPTAGITKISFASKRNGIMEFKVYNLLGEMVYETTVQATIGENELTFDASNLPDGMYMYVLSDGDESVTKRMTISKN